MSELCLNMDIHGYKVYKAPQNMPESVENMFDFFQQICVAEMHLSPKVQVFPHIQGKVCFPQIFHSNYLKIMPISPNFLNFLNFPQNLLKIMCFENKVSLTFS